MGEDPIIIIPAYNPDEKLIKLVKELKDYNNKILIVDDGSNEQKIFNKIKNDCEIIHNTKNLGKGAALKKGFKYILANYTNSIGIVTADADGQHLSKDIEKIKNELFKSNESIILGVRNFNENGVPIRNKIGNKIMSYLYKIRTGLKIKDTQTGLRGIPKKYLNEIINIPGNRFEYEMNILNYFANKVGIQQIDINTLYSNGIKTEFKTLKDSFNIIKNFLRN